MLTIDWQDQRLHLRRLVTRPGVERSFDLIIARIARDHHLEIVNDDARPEPGDFWIGAHPRTGWGDADARRIAWASIVEAPLALQVLQQTSRSQRDLRSLAVNPFPDAQHIAYAA